MNLYVVNEYLFNESDEFLATRSIHESEMGATIAIQDYIATYQANHLPYRNRLDLKDFFRIVRLPLES